MLNYLRIAIIFLIALVPSVVGAESVLMLRDDGSELQIQPALEAAGHTVTDGGRYDAWDGITPSVSDFDVVVFLNAWEYGYPLLPAAATALQDYVAGGGGIVMTEWTAYDVCHQAKGPVVAALIPVTMPNCSDYGEVETWTVTDPAHPLTAGVPASWIDNAGWSTVTPKLDSIVVVTGAGGNAMVSYSRASGGVVVHLNHDMIYSTASIHPNALQLMVNAAEFASVNIFADGFESGGDTMWSSSAP